MSDNKATYEPNERSGTQPIGPAEEFAVAVDEAIQAAPDFASDEAAEAWIDAGQPSLEDTEPTGKTGFTKADVLSAAEE